MHQTIPNPYRECKKLIFCLDQGFKEDFTSTLSAFAFIFKICDQANFSRTLTPKHDQKKSNFYQGSNKLMKQKYQINECASPVSTYFCAHLQNKNVGLAWFAFSSIQTSPLYSLLQKCPRFFSNIFLSNPIKAKLLFNKMPHF